MKVDSLILNVGKTTNSQLCRRLLRTLFILLHEVSHNSLLPSDLLTKFFFFLSRLYFALQHLLHPHALPLVVTNLQLSFELCAPVELDFYGSQRLGNQQCCFSLQAFDLSSPGGISFLTGSYLRCPPSPPEC